jgi:transposase-like protein
MKRSKKAIPKVRVTTLNIYTIQCPHCMTFLQGGFNDSTLRFKCTNCNNPIDVDWENCKDVV